MKVAVDPTQVDVSVEDEGPGIPDIELAMQEGFSTAPPEARDLGFGAGMGLPNIKRNTDQFAVQSTVGQGTQVRFRIFLKPQEPAAAAPNSVHIRASRCRQCLACLRACPTHAVRVRDGRPWVLDRLCVDCTSCLAVCEPGAIALDALAHIPAIKADTVLVLPDAFLEQFLPQYPPEAVLAAVHEMGFGTVRFAGEWEEALRAAVVRYAREEAAVRPVLSPMCPAVVNLIQVRYPSLLSHVAPFLTPIEAAREELTVPHAVFVGICPAQHTALRAANLLTRIEVVAASALRSAAAIRSARHAAAGTALAAAPEDLDEPETLRVCGMPHVVHVLDDVENELVRDCAVIELFACVERCFGSPVWAVDAHVAKRRYDRGRGWHRAQWAGRQGKGAAAVRRQQPLQARAGLRLDPDMRAAIEKLAQLDTLIKQLPGRNCGVCGAPTCAALAEDIVRGAAHIEACGFRTVRPAEEKQ